MNVKLAILCIFHGYQFSLIKHNLIGTSKKTKKVCTKRNLSHSQYKHIKQEKIGRDMIQSYDKSHYTKRKAKRAK